MARARNAWRIDEEAGVGGISPERLVFLDEYGVLTNMACLYGRAPCGQRARGTANAGRWKRVTVLGALGVDGIVAAMSVEAATDAAVSRPTWTRCCCPGCAKRVPTRCW